MKGSTQRDLLVAISQDVRWLKVMDTEQKKHLEHIETHLDKLNDTVAGNKTRSKTNRYGLIGSFALIGTIITILLHLIGVY